MYFTNPTQTDLRLLHQTDQIRLDFQTRAPTPSCLTADYHTAMLPQISHVRMTHPPSPGGAAQGGLPKAAGKIEEDLISTSPYFHPEPQRDAVEGKPAGAMSQ